MRSARSLLGILGSLTQNSPNRSQVALRPGSRIRFIGRGFISPRRGTSTHHSAGSGPLPRRAGRWVRSLLTKFSGSFERSQNRPNLRAAARRSRGQAPATRFSGSPTPRRTVSDTAIASDCRVRAILTSEYCVNSGIQEVSITGRSGADDTDGIGSSGNASSESEVLFQCEKYAH